MSIPRIFHPEALEKQKIISLSEQASQHLIAVLRLKKGDSVFLLNGSGSQFLAEIINADKHQTQVMIHKSEVLNTESALKIYLGQGISRGEKMDFTIQKSVELGVTQIIPLFTQYCNVQLDAKRQLKRQEHWQKIAQSACEQSGRGFIPEVLAPTNLSAWIKNLPGISLICNPNASESLSKLNLENKFLSDEKRINLLVGPEGGFSTQEILEAEQTGFQSVALGPRILRTETAALVALTILQSHWGDL